MIDIIPVVSTKQRAEFIDFPHALYIGDPNYVPELFMAQDDLLNPDKHPFYQHSTAQLFLAFRDNKIVGRIAAIWNTRHDACNHVDEGQFGFFDWIDDQEGADGLLNTAYAWVKDKGGNHIVGPRNRSTDQTCGLRIEGFDSPPV